MEFFVWFVNNRRLFNVSAVASLVQIDQSTLTKAIARNVRNRENGLSQEDAARFKTLFDTVTRMPEPGEVIPEEARPTARRGRPRKQLFEPQTQQA